MIIVIGNTINNISHIWLVDGGYHIKTHYVSNVSHDGINWEILNDWITELTYNHINWGWNGVFNGFFLYNVFNAENSSCSIRTMRIFLPFFLEVSYLFHTFVP